MTTETEKMPEHVYIRDCNWVNGCLPVNTSPSTVFKDVEYVRADTAYPVTKAEAVEIQGFLDLIIAIAKPVKEEMGYGDGILIRQNDDWVFTENKTINNLRRLLEAAAK